MSVSWCSAVFIYLRPALKSINKASYLLRLVALPPCGQKKNNVMTSKEFFQKSFFFLKNWILKKCNQNLLVLTLRSICSVFCCNFFCFSPVPLLTSASSPPHKHPARPNKLVRYRCLSTGQSKNPCYALGGREWLAPLRNSYPRGYSHTPQTRPWTPGTHWHASLCRNTTTENNGKKHKHCEAFSRLGLLAVQNEPGAGFYPWAAES